MQHCTIPYNTTPHYTTLDDTTPHHITQHNSHHNTTLQHKTLHKHPYNTFTHTTQHQIMPYHVITTFKLYYKQEKHLSEVNDFRYITVTPLCRFKLNLRNFRFQTQWCTIPKLEVNQTKYIYCDSHETEDELHFLNKGTLYK